MILALCTPSRFASSLDCRKQQTGKQADDGYHNQQLYQSERPPAKTKVCHRGFLKDV
jgi:hypothetical protein